MCLFNIHVIYDIAGELEPAVVDRGRQEAQEAWRSPCAIIIFFLFVFYFFLYFS